VLGGHPGRFRVPTNKYKYANSLCHINRRKEK
jgi:hypothetical protein